MLTENQMLLRKTRHPKPHLYLRSGYWRVSLMPKPYWRYKTDFTYNGVEVQLVLQRESFSKIKGNSLFDKGKLK